MTNNKRMRFRNLVAKTGNRKFVIEYDLPEVGCYLRVYENSQCIHDSLQDTEAMAKEEALEQWRVQLNEWNE